MGKKKRADFFVDVMGHDVNNLNQVILANLELLQESNRLEDMQNRLLEDAILATKDSKYTVMNVRALHDIYAGAARKITNIDLCRTIRECVREVPRPAGKKVTIRYEPPGKPMFVKAVPDLKLAFLNVIASAIRHSGPAVLIDIGTSETIREGRQYYAVTVTDNGNGMPDKIKKSFSGENGEDAAALHGKGLGLYTAKALAGVSGGWMEIADRAPGDYTKGTKITITLPASEALSSASPGG